MFKRRAQQDLNGGFEPHMLIEAAMEQAPAYPWLSEALRTCSPARCSKPGYIRYVSMFSRGGECIVIEHETWGTVVIDTVEGYRIGSIELVDRLDQ